MVLAAQSGQIGIDVMDVRPPSTETVSKYLTLMAGQFTLEERGALNSQSTDMEKLVYLYPRSTYVMQYTSL